MLAPRTQRATGDEIVVHRLYQRHMQRVRALVGRIVGPQDAEELTQEVFLKVLRGIGGFRGESQLGTWIHRLAVNTALNHATRDQARRRMHLGTEVLLEQPAQGPPGPGDPWLRGRLQGALAALPAGYRAVLVLHDVEGLTHDEIAQTLGVPVGTSKSLLHRARARVRTYLHKRQGHVSILAGGHS